MAHDPKNGIRILTWRATNGTIMLQPEVGGVLQNPSNLASHVAYDTPSIACGDAQIAKNCVLMWASPADNVPYHNMRWFQFRVSNNGGQYGVNCSNGDCTNVYTLSYKMFSGPQVTYVGPSGSNAAFVATWKNPGCNFYSLRKSASETALFTDEVGHNTGACNHHMATPAAGSVSQHVELLTIWR